MRYKLLTFVFLASAFCTSAQNGWTVCNAPNSNSRIDDIFMVNSKTGYAVNGAGMIMKTTDGGENWNTQLQNSNVYCRSVEFIDEQKGFVGSFPNAGLGNSNILRMTTNGGATWTDLTPSLHPRARSGICGLAVADINTIYGGGNWFEDSAYIIKSTDGGTTWKFINMSAYASSIIDLHFLSKNVGFAIGKSKLPFESAIILYTTDGGVSWSTKYQANTSNSYCWKIQRLTPLIYFVAVEDLSNVPAKVLRSDDGGMSWTELRVSPSRYNIEGIGFIDPMHGWTGGSNTNSFGTKNGGLTWDSIQICPLMNRVFKVNDTMLFASGRQIWKYKGSGNSQVIPSPGFASLKCYPNPARDLLSINIVTEIPTHVSVLLLDASGRRVKVVENAQRTAGSYRYSVDVNNTQPGLYYVVLKTHEEKLLEKVIVGH